MKTTRLTTLITALLMLLSAPVKAQDGAAKAKMADIRKTYEWAMKLEKDGQNDKKPNYQRFESATTATYGTTKHTVDFIFDNSEFVEELQVNPCELVMVRQKTDSDVQEYLYNKDGELIFFYSRTTPGNSPSYGEYRYYYDQRGPFWKIEKLFNAKTNKLESETSEAVDPSVAGTEHWYMRVASDLKQAFLSLNMLYD